MHGVEKVERRKKWRFRLWATRKVRIVFPLALRCGFLDMGFSALVIFVIGDRITWGFSCIFPIGSSIWVCLLLGFRETIEFDFWWVAVGSEIGDDCG